MGGYSNELQASNALLRPRFVLMHITHSHDTDGWMNGAGVGTGQGDERSAAALRFCVCHVATQT